MGNKKSAHQTYAMGASSALRDKLEQGIVEKALKYDVALFQNPDLASMLCDTTVAPCELSPSACKEVTKVLEWLVQSQNAAQLSSDG